MASSYTSHFINEENVPETQLRSFRKINKFKNYLKTLSDGMNIIWNYCCHNKTKYKKSVGNVLFSWMETEKYIFLPLDIKGCPLLHCERGSCSKSNKTHFTFLLISKHRITPDWACRCTMFSNHISLFFPWTTSDADLKMRSTVYHQREERSSS